MYPYIRSCVIHDIQQLFYLHFQSSASWKYWTGTGTDTDTHTNMNACMQIILPIISFANVNLQNHVENSRYLFPKKVQFPIRINSLWELLMLSVSTAFLLIAKVKKCLATSCLLTLKRLLIRSSTHIHSLLNVNEWFSSKCFVAWDAFSEQSFMSGAWLFLWGEFKAVSYCTEITVFCALLRSLDYSMEPLFQWF